MSETTLAVTGLTCADCAHHVEKTLKRVSGVRNPAFEVMTCTPPPTIDCASASVGGAANRRA